MKRTFLFLVLILAGFRVRAQTLQLDSTQLTITVAIDSNKITAPWDIEWGFDNRLWMTDTRHIKRWDPVTGTMKTLFSFPRAYGLGIAVPKTLPSTGPVYVYAVIDTGYYYAGSSLARLYRFVYDAANDVLTNPVILLNYTHLSEHSGGKVIIGSDGKIWLTTPEFTYANDTIGATVGRTLRMNPDGSYPAGNLRPDLTYSIGHRNAQGMVQLPDGTIFCTEHSGPSIRDEVNLISLGGNYGWPAVEGYNFCTGFVPDSCASAGFMAKLKRPVYSGTLTPGGLDYYDHPAIPEWRNCLIVGTLWQPDSCLAVLKLTNDHDSVVSRRNYLKKHAGGINDFKRTRDVCVATDGSIYFLVHDRSFTNSGDTLKNIGGKIIRIRNNTFVNVPEIDRAGDGITAYPNPASDKVSITVAGYKSLNYRIIDAQGRTIIQGKLAKGTTMVDTSRWHQGWYEILCPDSLVKTKRILIMR